MSDLTISITGANGDTITFDSDNYILAQGVRGFGVPVTNLRVQESAGDGGVFRHTKRGVREVDLPIAVLGADRADTETKLRRLATLLQNSAGASVLTATYANGDVYQLQVYYAGGADATFGQNASGSYCMWMITLQAPNPFWTSANARTFSVTQSNTGRGLLPQLSRLKVTAAQAIGVVTVNNTEGDVASYPVWQVYGPLTNLEVNNGSVGFTYTQPIAGGSVITIDTANGTVVDELGVNKYSNLGSAPKFFTIPKGSSSINITGDGATTASMIACTYYPRREVLF